MTSYLSSDVSGLILSYLPDDTLETLYSLGLVPTLATNARDQMFWRRRVEVLLKRVLHPDIARDWRSIYQSLCKRKNFSTLVDLSDNREVLQVLYFIGVRPTEEDLLFASRNNLPNSLQFILDEGSLDPNCNSNQDEYIPSCLLKGEYGYESDTALTSAAECGSIDCVRILLLDERVDVNLPSAALGTALEYACLADREDIPVSNYEDIVSLLLADGRLEKIDWEAVWQYSIDQRDNRGIIQLLLERDIPVPWIQVMSECITRGAVKCLALLLKEVPSWMEVDLLEDLVLDEGRTIEQEMKLLQLILEDRRCIPQDNIYSKIICSDRDEESMLPLISILLADGRANPGGDNGSALADAVDYGLTEVEILLLEDPRV